ncbi:unnamed protein product [Trichogramma brassicae]|uniref:Uncharacterized protein n=1 Tax=Trichogramma brassicae TaxID=86971 RepID=A0A6H5IZG3_9HYME|nr:unnamed protein product [Trichogramma brassicae]
MIFSRILPVVSSIHSGRYKDGSSGGLPGFGIRTSLWRFQPDGNTPVSRHVMYTRRKMSGRAAIADLSAELGMILDPRLSSFEFLQGDGRYRLLRSTRQLQGGHPREQSRNRAAHQEKEAGLLGLWASQARHGNLVWFAPDVAVDLVAKLPPASTLAGLDRHVQKVPCGGVVRAVGFFVLPASRSLEESASPQAGAPEISDLDRPPVHRLTTVARIYLGHRGITCASDDGHKARRHILCSPGSDRCAGHGGRETVRIECTGVPSAALARQGPGGSPGVLDLEDDSLMVAVRVPPVYDFTRGVRVSQTYVRSTIELPCRPLKVGTSQQHRVEESERVEQDGRPRSSLPTSPLRRPCVEVSRNNKGSFAASLLGDVGKEGRKFHLRESWRSVDAEKENSADSGPREVRMYLRQALLHRNSSLHPDSCLAVGIGEPCIEWSKVLVLLT